MRVIATEWILESLATVPDLGTVYVGVRDISETDVPCVCVIPGMERSETDDYTPLGPVVIDYKIAAYARASAPEYSAISALIASLRNALEAEIPTNFDLVYSGAEPIYSASGSALIGAELSYNAMNYIG